MNNISFGHTTVRQISAIHFTLFNEIAFESVITEKQLAIIALNLDFFFYQLSSD